MRFARAYAAAEFGFDRPLGMPTTHRNRTCFVAAVAWLAALTPLAARAHGPRDLPSTGDSAPDPSGTPIPPPTWYGIHYQFTAATQYHPSFSAKYSGENSLRPDSESATA